LNIQNLRCFNSQLFALVDQGDARRQHGGAPGGVQALTITTEQVLPPHFGLVSQRHSVLKLGGGLRLFGLGARQAAKRSVFFGVSRTA
jgi:hypothetical protein